MRRKRTCYSPELGEAICRRVAAGASLAVIASEPGMPSISSMAKWRRTLPEFAAELRAARRTRALASLLGERGEARPMGAPEVYTPELGRKVCELMMGGTSTRELMARPDLPHIQTIRGWLVRHPEFRELYVFAAQVRAQVLADDVMAIADAVSSKDEVAMARLQVEARKWTYGALSAQATTEIYGGAAHEPGRPQSYEEALREIHRRRAARAGHRS